MKCEEAQELITALVDRELSGPERSSIEKHLEDCPRCHFIYQQELNLKADVQRAGSSLSAPASLRRRILSDNRVFPQRTEPEAPERPEGWAWLPRSFLRPAFALAILLLLALPVFYWRQPSAEPIALAALSTHERVLRGEPSLVKYGSEGEVVKRLSASVEGRFAPMGYDLSMMKLRVAGGLTEELQGRKVLVAVYKGEAPSLSCFTFIGTEADAPKNARVVYDPEKKMNFYAFSRGEVNGVMHQEGRLICILVSKIPMDDLLALARAKARRY